MTLSRRFQGVAVVALMAFALSLLPAWAQLPGSPPEPEDGVPEPGWFGFGFHYRESVVAPGQRQGWLLVQLTVPGGPMEKAGLKAQDLITEIDGKPLLFDSQVEAIGFFSRIPPGKSHLFTVRRGQETLTLEVRALPMPQAQREAWKMNYELARKRDAAARKP